MSTANDIVRPFLLSLSAETSVLNDRLPACAAPCFTQYCTDLARSCICSAVKYDIDSCVLSGCGLPEAIFTRNVTETSCDSPVRNRSRQFNIMVISTTVVALIFVTLRLAYKNFFSAHRRLTAEDWTLLAATSLGLPSAALTIFGLTARGLGQDVWGLRRPDFVAFARFFFVIQVIYLLLMLLIKLTLTLFYRSIFRGIHVRRLLAATLVFHIIVALAFILAVVFQCMPIAYQWRKVDLAENGAAKGHCFNINAAGWSNAAISVASDLWLIAIPLCQIHKLKLHWKKKLGAALMFLTGASVTVVSFLRLASVRHYSSTSNPSWDQWEIVWWSVIEVSVGFICTCMPAVRLILVQLWPRIFGSDHGSQPYVVNYQVTLSRYTSRPQANTNPQDLYYRYNHHNRHIDQDDDEDDGLESQSHSPSEASKRRASDFAADTSLELTPTKPDAAAAAAALDKWRTATTSPTTLQPGAGFSFGRDEYGTITTVSAGRDAWLDETSLDTAIIVPEELKEKTV